MKKFRQGAAGALLDEYERSIADLRETILPIPDHALTIITDPVTEDENTRSLQTILAHVVHSGYGYAVRIYNLKGHDKIRPDKTFRQTVREYMDDLASVFSFTEMVLKEVTDTELEEFDNELKIQSGWGQVYDREQMMEHAIVHILRHRRQIERIQQEQLANLL